MTKTTLADRLERLPGIPSPQADRFVAEIEGGGRTEIQALVDLWLTSSPELSRKARGILAELGPKALDPLLAAPLPKAVDDRVWLIRTLVLHAGQSRQPAAAWLDKLLDDVRQFIPKPLSAGPEPEEKLPAHRVCDEAYLAARRLGLGIPRESIEGYLLFEHGFFAKTEAERDVDIRQLKQSATWTQWIRNHPHEPKGL